MVLSPGFSRPRAALSGSAEELAGHGCAVALTGHDHEPAGTELPDDRVPPCAARQFGEPPRVPPGRAQDVSFVLDHLADFVDERKIALVGHSTGGASASGTMLRDERDDVGVSGSVLTRSNRNSATRPAAGRSVRAPPGVDESGDRIWEKLGDPKRWTLRRRPRRVDRPATAATAGGAPLRRRSAAGGRARN